MRRLGIANKVTAFHDFGVSLRATRRCAGTAGNGSAPEGINEVQSCCTVSALRPSGPREMKSAHQEATKRWHGASSPACNLAELQLASAALCLPQDHEACRRNAELAGSLHCRGPLARPSCLPQQDALRRLRRDRVQSDHEGAGILRCGSRLAAVVNRSIMLMGLIARREEMTATSPRPLQRIARQRPQAAKLLATCERYRNALEPPALLMYLRMLRCVTHPSVTMMGKASLDCRDWNL